MTAPAEPTATPATPASLFASLWAGAEFDAYVSRAMAVRQFPTGRGFGDAVWVHEPPAEPTCFFRVTPARFMGLVVRLQGRRETLAKLRAAGLALAPELAARAAELERVVERDTEVLRLLKAEFLARWPEAAKRLPQTPPEDLEDPARPSDAWADGRQTESRPVAVAPPLTPPEAALVEWAQAATAPAGDFRPTPYAVVTDGAAWLARLTARAAGDAPVARAAALARLRALAAAPPPPATAAESATARVLAARA